MAQKRDFEDRVVYLLTDFRANQWDDPAVLRKSLTRLQESGAQLQLVNCVDGTHANLAIAGLQAGTGPRAAGVPLWMEVSVSNYGPSPARDVSVLLDEDGAQRPAVVIERILSGSTVRRRFPVVFAAAGQHQITARLQADAVAADDVRYAVIEVAAALPVLVIDGDPRAQDALFLTAALSPGGNVKSGLSPIVESPRFLRDHDLNKYDSIFLLNVDRLDPAEIEPLEAYVRGGGGVGFFLGELSQADFINKHLYRDGEGLFPLPLAGATQLLVDRLDKAPDLEVIDHPVFSVFAGERNSFLNTVVIERYFAAQKNWTPPTDSTTQVIARLRTGAPLAVERRFGEGRVVAFLTKAAPVETPQGSWNNWGRNNPSYVVALLETRSLSGRAAARRARASGRQPADGGNAARRIPAAGPLRVSARTRGRHLGRRCPARLQRTHGRARRHPDQRRLRSPVVAAQHRPDRCRALCGERRSDRRRPGPARRTATGRTPDRA